MKRILLAVAAFAMFAVVTGSANADGPRYRGHGHHGHHGHSQGHHHGHYCNHCHCYHAHGQCRHGGHFNNRPIYGGGYGVPYGAGYSGGWLPYQGSYARKSGFGLYIGF